MKAALKKHLKRFARNQTGIVWIWVMCFLAIAVFSIVYWSFGLPALRFLETMLALFTDLPSGWLNALNFTIMVFTWIPFLMIIGLVFWAYTNSVRREESTFAY